MGYKAVRTERYKYVRYTDLEGMDELYDLVTDPFEMRNMFRDPKAADTLHMMQSELDSLLAATNNPRDQRGR
jgi:arylsulfatase A-like enzyme